MTNPSSANPATRVLSPDDAALDALWRETFGQPLPILGAGNIVREILKERGVTVPPAPPQRSGAKKSDTLASAPAQTAKPINAS